MCEGPRVSTSDSAIHKPFPSLLQVKDRRGSHRPSTAERCVVPQLWIPVRAFKTPGFYDEGEEMSRIPVPSKPPIRVMRNGRAAQEFCSSGFRSISWRSLLYIVLAFSVFLLALHFVG